ncbi:PAAR domain-containing protein [Flexibacterium corallicola]|uniref:PAAR domain-containing protein n=1 Tax=Flexibacterium corallicola TaxID=3037259 RepID=UPI00286F002B|nr:PAAR domain-containing protein [Pseudovibrio sp. M1P-2-3]
MAGLPASRVTDMHLSPMATAGVPHVGGPILPPGTTSCLIGGLPVATATATATCVGPIDTIVAGSVTCLVEKLPVARMGDTCAQGGTIITGNATCLIA